MGRDGGEMGEINTAKQVVMRDHLDLAPSNLFRRPQQLTLEGSETQGL